jgi:ABC-type Fe3+/spermidine/putrescine transport system ATPase subunit
LIQNDSPKETYENPYNDYVAKLLGEVNIFSEEEKSELNLSKKHYFPHQIKIAENGVEAVVLESLLPVLITGTSLELMINQSLFILKMYFRKRIFKVLIIPFYILLIKYG